MKVALSRNGLFVILRYATQDRAALGFVIKPVTAMLFSERHGHRRGFTVGPLYFRTFKDRAA